MMRQRISQRDRRALVEQDAHFQAGANALRAACSRTARTCSAVTPGNHSTNCDTCAPSSRFSNRAATGTRVPRNTQAPLTRSGSRSTIGQEDQSIMIPPFYAGALSFRPTGSSPPSARTAASSCRGCPRRRRKNARCGGRARSAACAGPGRCSGSRGGRRRGRSSCPAGHARNRGTQVPPLPPPMVRKCARRSVRAGTGPRVPCLRSARWS